jgi:hypothetical protein
VFLVEFFSRQQKKIYSPIADRKNILGCSFKRNMKNFGSGQHRFLLLALKIDQFYSTCFILAVSRETV